MYVLTNISPSISARPIYDLVTRTKPQLNRNVIAAVKNVANIDMCMRYGGVIMMDHDGHLAAKKNRQQMIFMMMMMVIIDDDG